MITPITGTGPDVAPNLPAGTTFGRTARLSAVTAPGGGVAEQAEAAFGAALQTLSSAGHAVDDLVHVVEYVCPDALADYPAVARARLAALDGHTPAVATVAVVGLPEPDALIAVEFTAHTGGGERVEVFPDSTAMQGNSAFHRGTLRVADDIVYLPSVHPIDSDGNLVAEGDFRGQYRHCLEATGELLAAAGLGLDALTQGTDYTSTATRSEYPRCGRPRKELLGTTGTDGRPVHPGAAGILVDQPIVPGAGVSLDCFASRQPLRAINPGWRRYETLTYKPGVAAGNTLFMSGFGALEPSTQKAIFEGDLLAQAEFTYAAISTTLREAGLTGSSVVRLIEYVLPEALPDYPKLVELRTKYFGERGPALTPVVVTALLRPEFLIEVVPTAVFDTDPGETA